MGYRTVVADDHRIVLDGLRLLLSSLNGEFELVASADDGRSAVKAVETHQPELVVIDVTMPDLNGIEATHRIRAACPNARVVALSGRQDGNSVTEMLRAGARGYVVKECAFEELAVALRTVMSGKIYLSPAIAGQVVDRMLSMPPPNEASGRMVLSPREREVVQLVAEGLTSKEMAARLFVSVKTIETHRKQIMDKLGIRTIAGRVPIPN